VLPVIGAIRSANALKRNSATGSTRLLTSAMAAQNKSTVVPFLINTIMMPISPSASMRNYGLLPEKELIRPGHRYAR
jgi:hypothetical protein